MDAEWGDWLLFGLFLLLVAVFLVGMIWLLTTAFLAWLRDVLRWWLGL